MPHVPSWLAKGLACVSFNFTYFNIAHQSQRSVGEASFTDCPSIRNY